MGRRTMDEGVQIEDLSAQEAEVDSRSSFEPGFEVASAREHEHGQHEIDRENILPTHDSQLSPRQPDNEQEHQRCIFRISRDEDDESHQSSPPLRDSVIIDRVPPAPSVGTAMRPLSNGAPGTLNRARGDHFDSSDDAIRNKSRNGRDAEEWHEGQDPLGEIDFEQFNTTAVADGENNDDSGDESF